MNKIKRILYFNLIIMLAFLTFGCSSGKVADEVVSTIPVEIVNVKKGDFVNTIILSGTTKAKANITIIPKIAGAEKITAIYVQSGDQVKAGQVLATLDQSTVSIQYNLAQQTYNDALKNYERQKALFEAGALPAAAFEQVTSQLSQAESALTGQRIAFENTVLKAPISGTITSILGEEGALASAQSPFAQIADISTLELYTFINEMQVNKLKAGAGVEVMIPALDKEIFSGEIISISPVMEDRLKAYPVLITLDNKEQKIKAGMYAEIEVVTDVLEDVLLVPAQAILIRDAKSSVYVVEEERAVKKEILTGSTNGQETVILEGLDLDEEVILRGNDNVVSEDLVSVVNRGEKQ